jgi:transcriptional regulator with GAF, ATPase, and Fis domain
MTDATNYKYPTEQKVLDYEQVISILESLGSTLEIEDKFSRHGIIGKSPGMQRLFSLLEHVIHTEARVLLEGESGTGKELVARILNYEGPRKDKSFIAIDCGALPQNLIESELFGYVKGAFTGADLDRKGIIE